MLHYGSWYALVRCKMVMGVNTDFCPLGRLFNRTYSDVAHYANSCWDELSLSQCLERCIGKATQTNIQMGTPIQLARDRLSKDCLLINFPVPDP